MRDPRELETEHTLRDAEWIQHNPKARRPLWAVLKKEGETDFPFFHFLVVVTAREYHVALEFCPEDEATCRKNTETCSHMSDLVCTIFTLDDG